MSTESDRCPECEQRGVCAACYLMESRGLVSPRLVTPPAGSES